MTLPIWSDLWKPQDDPDPTPKQRRSERLGRDASQIVPPQLPQMILEGAPVQLSHVVCCFSVGRRACEEEGCRVGGVLGEGGRYLGAHDGLVPLDGGHPRVPIKVARHGEA